MEVLEESDWLAPWLGCAGVAWCYVLLCISWLWCEPAKWRLSPNGRPTWANTLRGVFVLLAIVISIAAVMALISALLSLMHEIRP